MSERERLVELLLESGPIKERDLDDDWGDNEISDIAEHLLENGVIVPPVKVGQTVYYLNRNGIRIAEVVKIELSAFTNPQMWLTIEYLSNVTGAYECCKSRIDFIMNKTLFLTKEEAEKALKGGAE